MNMVSIRNSIYNIIDKVINQNFYDYLPEFIETLNKHKTVFTNILENDALNTADRNSIVNSLKDPISISGLPQKIALTQDFIQETIIISDLFKLNEMTAVELLLSGEAEMASTPGMSRGLIAVLSYYNSQKTIVDSLRSLLQVKSVISNDNPNAAEVINFTQAYCDSLFQNGLFTRLLYLLKTMNIKSEIDLLESQRALGTAKHRRQFYIIYNNIRETLAECIMLRSFKTPLIAKEMKALIEFIRENYRENDIEIKSDENTAVVPLVKKFDKCFIYLLISVMSSMNPTIGGHGNYEKDFFDHPIFTEDDFIKNINEIVQKNIHDSNYIKLKDFETKSVIQNFDQILYLAWVISLQKVSYLKQEKTISHPYQSTTNFGDYEDLFECDTFNMDSSNIYECFTFMICLMDIEDFHEENIWIKAFHDLITDFIIYMPKMLKDLKTESLRSGSNVEYFSSLLELIGNLYGLPEKLCEPFNVVCNEFLETLTLEYWSPQEILSGSSDIGSHMMFDDHNKHYIVKSNDSYRQATLFKFIRDCGDLFEHPKVFVNYIFMLKGLCNSERIALYIYNLLNSNQIGHQSSKLTWDWFSKSIYKHAEFLIANPHKPQMMDPLELEGLLVVLQIIKRVSHMNDKVCESMVCNESLMLVQNLILLLSCGVPKLLKAELLNCLSLFCQNPLVAKSIWQSLESNKIISTSPENIGCGIQMELAEIEPKLEEFYITRAFLNFLLAVTPHIVCDVSFLDQSITMYDRINSSIISPPTEYTLMEKFTYVIQSVMETVFLKHPMRTYKNIEEKFSICESFLKLCCKCVELFLSQSINAKSLKTKISLCQHDPGFFIISQLLCESQFFKTIVNIIDSGFLQITDSLNNLTFGPKTFTKETVGLLENSISLAMDLVNTIMQNESLFVELNSKFNSQSRNDNYRLSLRSTRPRNFVPQELSRLLMTTSYAQLFLQNLIKYISLVDENDKLARKALLIFNHCVKLVQPHSNLMLLLTTHNVVDTDILPLMVNCIDKFGDVDPTVFECMGHEKISKIFFNDYQADSPRTLVLKILINCLQQPTPNLGQYLMGFSCESIFSVKRTSLQEAGVGDFPKTCLHSLLNLIQRLVSDMVSNPFFKDLNASSESIFILTSNMIDLSLAYRILYLLASDSHTSMAVLRFIRSNYQFIFNQIDLLAFNSIKLTSMPELRAIVWNQKSWLLKIIAIEVRLCTANQQRSYISKLLKLLFGEDLYSSNNNAFPTWLSDENSGCQGLIYQLLEDFEITEPEEPNNFSVCQRLKPEILKEYLNDCLEDTYIDIQLMNGNKLKQMIFADINLAVDEEHIQAIQLEIDNICRFINSYNTNTIWLQFGKMSAVDAWRQVVEVVMLSDCSGEDCIDSEIKRKKIYEILQLINEKILAPSTPSCLITPFSRVCLILSAVFAGMFTSDYSNSSIMSLIKPDDEVKNDEEKRLESIDMDNLYNQLRILIKLTTRCIMEINYKYQNCRIKFYGVLSYLLDMVLKITHLKPNFSNLLNECYLIINNHSLLLEKISEKSLYSTVCCDCISGNIHLSLSSLTVLDCIVSVGQGSGGLTAYLVSHGYLNHFVDSLVRDCDNIFHNMKHAHDANYMHDSSNNVNELFPYYLYLSRMSLLCKLATQTSGARALVQCGALTSLSRCDLFRTKPPGRDCSSEMLKDDDNLEDIHTQHVNIVSFAIQLANNILSTLGIDTSDAVREVLVFIGESIQSLCEVFQSSSEASLKEMIQITNLFVLLVPGILNSKSLLEMEFKYRILEKIKIATAQMMTSLMISLNKSPIHSETEMMQHFLQLQLMGNFLMIASGMVSSAGDSSRRLFFSANIDDAIGGKNNWNSAIRKISQSIISGNKPSMSLLVIILYKMQECYENIMKKLAFFITSDYDINLNSDSKKLLTPLEVESNLLRMSTDQLQNLWNSVFEIVSNKQFNGDQLILRDFHNSIKENSDITMETDLVKDLVIVYKRITNVLTSLIGSLESCCFLLWNHALAYKSSSTDVGSFAFDTNLHPIQKLQKNQQLKLEMDQSRNINTNEDIAVILSKCIDDGLLNNLQTILENHFAANEESSAFSKVLIHRLTRMIKLHC